MTLEELARSLACEHARDDRHMLGIERSDAEVDAATKTILNQLKENQKAEEQNAGGGFE